MASILETAQMVAAAYGGETGEAFYAPGRAVDLDASAELC
jgi:hypothetical protein